MKRHETALLILGLSVATAMTAVAADYTDFAAQSEVRKDKVIWDLHERKEWGLPEQKPVCRDVLVNQGFHFANAIAWTTDAIDLAEKQNWDDLNPLITRIYEAPRNIWVYERAFRYLRNQTGKPVSSNLVEDAQTLKAAGFYESKVTDLELAQAKARLAENPDKEAVLVYAISVAGWHAGKGGTDRGRRAASDVLKGLKREDVVDRVRQLFRDCEDYMRPEIEWVAKYLDVELARKVPNQVPEDTARKLAAPLR